MGSVPLSEEEINSLAISIIETGSYVNIICKKICNKLVNYYNTILNYLF